MGHVWLDKIGFFAFPQPKHTKDEKLTAIIFQHCGIARHFTRNVPQALSARFPNRATGRSETIFSVSMRSRLDTIGYSKRRGKKNKLQAYNSWLASPAKIIYTAVAKITPNMLYCKWDEKECRLDIRRATGSAPIRTLISQKVLTISANTEFCSLSYHVSRFSASWM